MLLQELQQVVEDEQRGRDDARDAASKAERRVGEIASELEELRSQLEQVREKKVASFCSMIFAWLSLKAFLRIKRTGGSVCFSTRLKNCDVCQCFTLIDFILKRICALLRLEG